jgi:hypothetical protein
MVEYQKYKLSDGLLLTAVLVGVFVAGMFWGGLPRTVQNDNIGMASEIAVSEPSVKLCKLIVSQTTVYDDTALATVLGVGEYSQYAGFTVAIHEINDKGCLVNINGVSDYIAAGQIQRVGSLFVTVKEVLM